MFLVSQLLSRPLLLHDCDTQCVQFGVPTVSIFLSCDLFFFPKKEVAFTCEGTLPHSHAPSHTSPPRTTPSITFWD